MMEVGTTPARGDGLPLRVRVTAPAKVLLFGEHAVVYGCPAIAVALTDLRLTVSIERTREHDAAVEFLLDDIKEAAPPHGEGSKRVPLKRRYAFETLRRIAGDSPSDDAFLPRPNADLLGRIEETVREEHPECAKSLRPAIFLCCALLHSTPLMTGEHGRLRVQASAGNFPIGAGLGSSAAFGVALAGALAQFHERAPTLSEDARLDLVNRFAFSSEVILHGSPSGVDNTVSAYGGALSFRKLPSPSYTRVACDLTQFRFLVVNTRVPRSTKEQVANVRVRYDTDPKATQIKFDAIEEIIATFTDLGSRGELTEQLLGTQMASNHTILNELGVGHERIEDVAKICGAHGIWTKLTGAGGGGCTISLVPRSLSEGAVTSVVAELEGRGFQCFVSAVGGAGFTVEHSETDCDKVKEVVSRFSAAK